MANKQIVEMFDPDTIVIPSGSSESIEVVHVLEYPPVSGIINLTVLSEADSSVLSTNFTVGTASGGIILKQTTNLYVVAKYDGRRIITVRVKIMHSSDENVVFSNINVTYSMDSNYVYGFGYGKEKVDIYSKKDFIVFEWTSGSDVEPGGSIVFSLYPQQVGLESFDEVVPVSVIESLGENNWITGYYIVGGSDHIIPSVTYNYPDATVGKNLSVYAANLSNHAVEIRVKLVLMRIA